MYRYHGMLKFCLIFRGQLLLISSMLQVLIFLVVVLYSRVLPTATTLLPSVLIMMVVEEGGMTAPCLVTPRPSLLTLQTAS